MPTKLIFIVFATWCESWAELTFVKTSGTVRYQGWAMADRHVPSNDESKMKVAKLNWNPVGFCGI